MCQNCNQNNCGGCTEVTTICNQCQSEETTCDCAVILSSDCINYDQDSILYGETVVVPKNTILSVALDNIVQFFKVELEAVKKFLRIVNTGTGASIYSGMNLLGEKKLRKLNSTSSIVTITENTDDISVGLNTAVLDTFIEANQKTYSATNIGTGANIYKDTTVVENNTQFNIRKINTSNSGTGATVLKPQVENTNDISIIAKTLIVESQGAGTSLIRDLQVNTDDNKLRLKSIKSSSLNITSTADEILIETPTLTLGQLKTFYVNNTYVPTIDSPSDGSIIRPYITYDEAKTAFIGTGTLTVPQFIGSTIILQTSSATVVNPTVNNLILEFQNGSALIYTGADLYMFDTEILYSLIPKNAIRQDLTVGIKIVLTGIGTITRTAGIGLVRGMGSNRSGLAQFGDKFSEIHIGFKSSDIISLIERIDYPNSIWDGDTTNAGGVTYESIYGIPYKYSLQLFPTVPLVYTKYNNINNTSSRGVNSIGTLGIKNLANTSILIDSVDVLFTADNVDFTTETQYIATSSATKMVDFPTYYTPRTNKNYIEGSGGIFCKKITAGRSDVLGITGVDNFFKFTNNAGFLYGTLDINSIFYVNKFINISDITNTNLSINVANELKGSSVNIPGRYFVDTNQTTLTVLMPNSTISPFLNKSVTVVDIIPNTKGTLSTFFDKPVISGIDNYTNDTAASAAGLVTNGLYFNTTNNALDLVY
jgi:hypothetical protein